MFDKYEFSIINRIKNGYDHWITKIYVFIRFIIIRIDILSLIESYLPKCGELADIGCGFGLFSLYFKLKSKSRHIIGIDINPKRIEQCKKVAQKLKIDQIDFFCGNVVDFEIIQLFDGIVILDLLHHISPFQKWMLLETCYQHLNAGGVLVIKDVTTHPLWKYLFNYFMDLLVVGREADK